ncbi:hypothetical protein BK809_0002715, partial [Diplodia seriata]
TYRTIRRTLATNNALAFLLLSTTRVTPPRLLPPSYRYVDILHRSGTSGSAWTHNRFQLTIAAMPSLHFGTALFLAACLARFAPHGWLRCVAWLWPVAMGVTVLATANHWVADMLGGVAVTVLGWAGNRVWVLLGGPVEAWAGWVVGVGEEEGGVGGGGGGGRGWARGGW